MSEITEEVKESLRLIEDLKFFLATAPANWQENQVIRRYYLNNDEGFVSCVFWNNLYFITGTDIVRCILYKFQHFGRTITDRKKFEEGIFSDLRNLKAGADSVLEDPKLPFLEFLYNNSCLRTQKKQKVFYWFNVPHDKLMADALERDIKKEKLGQTPTSVAVREPAILFNYIEDKKRSLYDQLSEHLSTRKYEDFSVKSETEDGLRSPEYNVKTPEVQGREQFHPEEEDEDFPLDYLDKGANDHGYINLDSNHYSGKYINSYDTNFESIDPGMFLNSVNVASNDDYLIEHTVPLRAGSATLVSFPRLAKIFDDQAAFFPYPYAATATGSQYPPSAMIAQFPPSVFDGSYFVHEPMHNNYEVESYPHMGATTMAAVPSVVHFEPPPPPQYYGVYDDVEYMKMAVPSERQQEVSATMMRKRKQLQRHRVFKPTKSGKCRSAEYEAKIRHLSAAEQENLEESHIPTPESSVVITSSDQQHG